ncbi:MAG TPA: cell division protein FtsZ [Fimbriimonadaceae bacterium]|nr:cell division protein FtsZ [Fimbriimonadaceae bacterium]
MRPDNLFDNQATIKVIGVGGAGSNAVSRMIEAGLGGVKFIVANTDAQALSQVQGAQRLQIGEGLTRGLGAGGDPSIGEGAARESEQAIAAQLQGVDMLFITAGMGGGTGTGAAPVIADLARRMGILTVGVVTKPFLFEGPRRKRLADDGAARLKAAVDTLITVPNNRLVEVVDKKATMQQAFMAADDVLRQGVQGISEIILLPGIINVDFADVRSVMSNAGVALMGLGKGSGENRARIAAQNAANSPLLETSINGAKRLLINITAGEDFSIGEAHEAMEYIIQFADLDDADIIMGHVMREMPDDEIAITLLAAGMDPADSTPLIRNTEVFYTPRSAPAPRAAARVPEQAPRQEAPRQEPVQVSLPAPIQLDEIDLDLPAFLRRQKEAE